MISLALTKNCKRLLSPATRLSNFFTRSKSISVSLKPYSTVSMVSVNPDTTSGHHIPTWFSVNPTPIPTFSSLQTDVNVDVTVVGGGIAGLTTAFLLSKRAPLLSVILLEDGEIASGESGRTTAHIFNGIDDRYQEIEKKFGIQGSTIMAQSHTAAIDLIDRITKEENVDCEFERLPGYLFLDETKSTMFLEKEMEAAKKAGLVDVEIVDLTNMGKALKFPNQAQFHPLKYLCQLALAASKNGVKIFTRTHANEFKEGEKDVTIITSSGHVISSTYCVLATNVPVNDKIRMFTKMEPYRTYVVTGEVPKGSIQRALFWDTHDPYHYVRLTNGQDPNTDIIVIGGEDHLCGRNEDMEERYNNLESWAKKKISFDFKFCK